MQKELSVKDLQNETYEEFLEKLEISQQQYKEGKVHDAREVFEELKKKYGY